VGKIFQQFLFRRGVLAHTPAPRAPRSILELDDLNSPNSFHSHGSDSKSNKDSLPVSLIDRGIWAAP